MLWYKAWLDTRTRFLIGLVLIVCSAAVAIGTYPKVLELMPLVPSADATGEMSRRIREVAEISREFRGYVWWQWYRQNLTQMATVFAVLLGTGGLLAQSTGGALFTLSLPVSRNRLLGVRAAAGLSELLVLALAASFVIPLLSLSIGQRYSLVDASVHGFCVFVAAAFFFSLASLLSTMFADVWRPILGALAIAMCIGFVESAFRGVSPHSLFGVMNGEAWFRSGQLPWIGLLISATASAAMFYGASVNLSHRDF